MRTGSRRPSSLKSLPAGTYVFAFVFLLRLIVLLRLTESPFLLPASGDMHFYNEWARRILGGQWTDQHAFYGLPLYPYLLAGTYKVFGYNPFVPGFFQALLEAGTGVLIYNLAVEIFGAPQHWPDSNLPARSAKLRGQCIGALAALGWGFFLPQQAYSVILMPTAGLVFVFWFIVRQVLRRREIPAPWAILVLGVLIGFTAMGVATILFLVPLLLGAVLFRWSPSGKPPAIWRSRLTAAALLFLGIGAGASPCWIHNYFVARDPVFLSAHSGVNFWIGNNPLATGYPRFPPGLRAGQRAMLEDSIHAAEEVAGRPLKRSEVSDFWSEKARVYITNNLGAWLHLVLSKMKNFWNAFQYDDLSIITILREQGVLMPGLKFGLVAAFAIPGLVIAAFRFPASRWISAAVLLHMGSLLTVFVTERYRVAAVPGLLLGASFLIWELWESSFEGKCRRAGAVLVLLLGATWFVSLPQRAPGLWALDAYNSGWQALRVNDLPLARKRLEIAYGYVRENSEINFALGNLHLAEGDRGGAKKFYAETLQIDPRHPGALNNLGVMALDEDRWDAAIAFFESALSLSPDDAKGHYLLARALLEKGDKSRALSEVQVAIRLDPNQPAFATLRDQLVR